MHLPKFERLGVNGFDKQSKQTHGQQDLQICCRVKCGCLWAQKVLSRPGPALDDMVQGLPDSHNNMSLEPSEGGPFTGLGITAAAIENRAKEV